MYGIKPFSKTFPICMFLYKNHFKTFVFGQLIALNPNHQPFYGYTRTKHTFLAKEYMHTKYFQNCQTTFSKRLELWPSNCQKGGFLQINYYSDFDSICVAIYYFTV